MDIIHCDSSMKELGVILCFESFDAEAGLSSEGAQCDFSLVLCRESQQEYNISPGDFIYAEGGEFGGEVESVRLSADSGRVTVSGVCWRGRLDKAAVVPLTGETHVTLEQTEANAALRSLLPAGEQLITVDAANSGLNVSGSIRYKTLLESAELLLKPASGRLGVSFDGRNIVLSAARAEDRSSDIELSAEYDLRLSEELTGVKYNHIIALGQGSMLERQVVELCLLENGELSDNMQAHGAPPVGRRKTLIYDYPSVESLSELRSAAKRKLAENIPSYSAEVSAGDYAGAVLEIGDRVSVRSTLTGEAHTMVVTSKRLCIRGDAQRLYYTIRS